MGAHPIHHEGADGVHFAVWAPNAPRQRDRRLQRLGRPAPRHGCAATPASGRSSSPTAAGSLQVRDHRPGRQPPAAEGRPLARASELRPATASVVAPELEHDWGDAAHREHWSGADARREPISIYEVHPGSWQRGDGGGFLSWDELADRLIPYVADLGFTHIEFLPITEHPYDPSLQTTGLYALGPLRPAGGFARFVDGAHRAGIGVILDWVPAHFPTDEHGLARFDGTALYEHADPRQGFHPDWNTAIYNFGRQEVFATSSTTPSTGLKVSRRRPARRRGRLDALPRLLAQGRRVDPEPIRRPREPRRRRLPAGDEPRGLRQAPGPGDLRRGIDLLAQGQRAGLRRRPRLRLQVEHGLDARHAAVPPASRSTPSTTTTS